MAAVVPLLTAVLLLLGFGVLVFASHGPANGHLVEVGPTHPDYGFPMWYKDANGLILEQCLDPNYCGFLPGDIPDPNAPLSMPDNFPEEAFYWLGEALMLNATPNGGTAILTLALEGAFNGGPPAVNDQIVFGRIRIRVDNLVQGETYTVTHPYGVEIFPDLGNDAGPGTAAGPGISFVEDIGIGAPGDFTGALNSRIGPFLTAAPNGPTPPPGFIGDGGLTEQRVVGSPYGTNFYRIEGVNVGAPGSPFLCADPALGPDPTATTDCIETDMFTLLGQIAANFGVESQSAFYSRDGSGDGSLDIFASTVPGEIIEAEGSNMGVLTLNGDGSGHYFGRTNFVGAPPTTITLANVSDAPPTLVNTAVTDMVIITKAEYDQDTGALTVEAYSSDAYSLPTLTAVGYGDLSPTGSFAASQGVFSGLTFPPASVTVVSAAGGSDTEPVQIVSGSWNVAPYALDDAAATPEETAVTINVVANDYDYDAVDTIQPATAALIDLPQNGSVVNNGDGTFTYTPDLNFVGTDRFRYTVQDSRGAASNKARVEITVSDVNDPPTAVDDTAVTYTIDVLANDYDIDGVLDPATVAIAAAPANGTAVPNLDGTITYTPTLGFVGNDSFTYTVNDEDGATSNAALVSVTVTNGAPVVAITAPADGDLFNEGAPVTFTGSVSDAEETGLEAQIVWTSDVDGALGTGATLTVSALSPGAHTITASVADSGGLSGSDSITIHINNAPAVSITEPAGGSSFTELTAVTFTGTANDAEDGDLSANLVWTSDLDGSIGAGSSFSTSALSIGTHLITASVSDSNGLSGQAAVTIIITTGPTNVAPTVSINAPADGASFEEGAAVTFTGAANDPEDGDLSASLAWTSDLDGNVGNGGSFTTASLSVGTHIVTASATDSGGLTGAAAITVIITPAPTDSISITRAEYTPRRSEWRVQGTGSAPGEIITIYVGPTVGGNVIATNVVVNSLGLWQFRERGSSVAPDGTNMISASSSGGGITEGFVIRIR